MDIKIGDTIRINYMIGEPDYVGKVGVVKSIDDLGQIYINNFNYAIIPDQDDFDIIKRVIDNC